MVCRLWVYMKKSLESERKRLLCATITSSLNVLEELGPPQCAYAQIPRNVEMYAVKRAMSGRVVQEMVFSPSPTMVNFLLGRSKPNHALWKNQSRKGPV